MPPLHPSNHEVMDYYYKLGGQLIVSMGGIIDVDIKSIIEYLKYNNIYDTELLDKIIYALRLKINYYNQKANQNG